MFAVGVVSIEVLDTQMPVWALVLALIVCTCYPLPFYMFRFADGRP